MFVPQWFQSLQRCLLPRRPSKARSAQRRPPARPRVQLCLEGLEERLTPSTVDPIGNDSPAVVGQANPAAASPTTTTATPATASFNSTNDQQVTLTANVTSSGGTVNEGTVTFTVLQGTRVIGTPPAPVQVNSSGQASVSYTLPAGTSAGAYTINAAYTDSSGKFADSADASQKLTVSSTSAADTKTTVTPPAAVSFSTSAQNVNLTATVTSNGTAVDTGSVLFTILQGNTPIGTATPATFSNGSWTASYSLPAGTSPGSYTIEADYFDNSGKFNLSTDTSQKLTVTASTTTQAAPVTVTFGATSVTLSAGVTSSGGAVNEGTVTFTILQGSTPIGTPPPPVQVSNGQASVSYSLPAGTAAGSYTISAAYHDPANIFGDSSDTSRKLTVNAATTTTIAASATTAFSSSDQNVTLSAVVTSSSGAVNEGNVTFTLVDNKGNTIGTATPSSVSNGQASVSYVVPGGTAAGSYVIHANYIDLAGNFNPSADNTQTLTIGAASATSLRLTTVNIVPSLSDSTAQVTFTVEVHNSAGQVNQGDVSITMAGVTGHGKVDHGTASVQLAVPLGTVSNLVTADMSYTDKAGAANFSDGSGSATVTTNLLNALLPADLTFDSSGNVQNQLNLAGNTSLFGFSYLASGLLTDVLFNSLSLPVTYSNLAGNTVTTFLGAPTAVTFANSSGQVLGYAKVFFDGTQLQWLLYDPSNHPIGAVPYTGLI